MIRYINYELRAKKMEFTLIDGRTLVDEFEEPEVIDEFFLMQDCSRTHIEILGNIVPFKSIVSYKVLEWEIKK